MQTFPIMVGVSTCLRKYNVVNWCSTVTLISPPKYIEYRPGEDVVSAYSTGGYASASGTSCAAPFVSGVAALYLERSPSATPLEIWKSLREDAVVDQLTMSFSQRLFGTPNRLVSTRGLQ